MRSPYHLLVLYFFILFFFSIKDVKSQGQANIWYTGQGAGLNFNFNPPVSMEDGMDLMDGATGEGAGAMSDANGNLLFYTNGKVIYNKNHGIMPNGAGLNGNGTTTQTGLILPINGDPDRYFVISTSNGVAVKYVIVNMTLEGGLGDVEVASKNVTNVNGASTNGAILLNSPKAEGALVVPEYNASNVPTGEYWLIFHHTTTNEYFVFKTNGDQISLTYSTYPAGFTVPGQPVMIMKVNSCFDKIVNVFYNAGRVEVLPFNKVTGVISSPDLVLSGTGAGNPFLNPEVYGVEFSPSGRYLYVTEAGLGDRKTVFQFDISLGTGTNPAAVIASRRYYTAGTEVTRFGAVQMGPDGKIYFPGFNTTIANSSFINVIPSPEVQWDNPPTLGVNIEYQKYIYGNKLVGEGLPPVPKSLIATLASIIWDQACTNSPTTFGYNFGGAVSSDPNSIIWNFGDGSGLVYDQTAPSHTYTTAGTYTVNLQIKNQCGEWINTSKQITIATSRPTVAPLPSPRCMGDNITITGTGANASLYHWYADATTTTPLSGGTATATYTQQYNSYPQTIWVQEVYPTYTVGSTNIATSGTQSGTVANNITNFDALTDITLYSVKVRQGDGGPAAGCTGFVVFDLLQNGVPVPGYNTSLTISCTGAPQTLTLNWNIPAGTGYAIRRSTLNKRFYYNTQAAAITQAGVITITGNGAGQTGPVYDFVVERWFNCNVRIPITVTEACGCTNPTPTLSLTTGSSPACAGSNLVLTASIGAASPTFVWYKDGVAITNSGATLTLNPISTSDAGDYSVTITTAACSFESNPSTNLDLTVNPRPALTNNPLTDNVCEGTLWAGVTLTSDVAGATFAWTSAASGGIGGNTNADVGNLSTQTFTNGNTTDGTVTYSITPTANSCSGTPTDFVVTVKPTPVLTNNPLTSSACEGTAWAGVALTADVAGTTFAWTSTASSGIGGYTTPGTGDLPTQTFTNSNSSSGTVTYDITPTANSCTGTTTNFVVSVNPIPTISNTPLTTEICEGTAWGGLTLTSDVAGATFAWTSVATGGIGGNTNADVGNLPTQTFTNGNTTNGSVTYSITPTANSCPGAPIDYVVTVKPTPVLTNNPLTSSACEGTAWTGVALTADVAGTTFSWTSTASSGIGGNTTPGTGDLPTQTFTNSNSTSGTVTYSITPTANSCSVPATDFVVTVNPIPVLTNSPLTDNICEGTAWGGLTLTSDVVGATFAWTSAATGGIGGNTTPGVGDLPTQTFTNGTIADGTVTYSVTPTANSCPGSSTNFVVTIKPTPVLTNSPLTANICEGTAWAGVMLTADVAETTFAWTSAATAGIIGNTNNDIGNIPTQTFDNTNAAAGTVTYSITPSANSCTGTPAYFIVTVDISPDAPVVTTPVTYCENETASALTAAGSGLLWYTVSSGGAGSGTAPTPSTTTVGAPVTTYYVSQTVNGCEGSRASIELHVNAIPSAPVVTTPITYCENETANQLTATGADLLWYAASSGGVGSATAPTPVTTPTGTTFYYVTQTVSNCESPRSSIEVVVGTNPSAPGVNSISYCKDEVASPLTATGLSLLWYTGSSGGIGSTTAPTPSTTTPGMVSYWVSASFGSCEGPRAQLDVTVIDLPVTPTVASPFTFCENSTATALTATGTDLLWYTVSSGGSGSSTAPTPGTSVVGAPAATYYVSQTVSGCEGPRALIEVNITALPGNPSVTTPLAYCQNDAALALTATGSDLLWYTGSAGGVGDVTAPTPVTTSAGSVSYWVSQTVNNCEGPRAEIVINVSATPAAPSVTSPVEYCDGASATALTATGSNLLWYTVSNGGSGSATAPTPSTAASGTTPYYVSQTIGGCEGLRAQVDVIVSSQPVAPTVTSPLTYCQNASATALTATGSGLLWYSGAIGGVGSSSSPVPSTGTIGTSAYFVSQTVGGCEGPRAQIDVDIIALPIAFAGIDINLDNFQSVTLSGVGSSTGANVGYQWTSNPSSTITTPGSITTQATPQAINTTYTLTVFFSDNPSCQSTDQVEVNVAFVVTIPNAFSPNGDGVHDVFTIQNIQYFPNSVLYVYNQWGELIFKSDAGYPDPWDGTRNGQFVPVSAYYYVLEINEPDFKPLSGEINVIR